MIDSIAASIDFRIIAPEIALVLASFIILITSYMKAWNRYAPHVAGAGLIMSLIFSISQLNNPQSGFFGMVTLDDFSAIFKIIFAASSAVILLLSQRFLAAKGINRPEFYALLCISTMGMMVMATTTDLVVIFLGLEIMSVPLYVMAGMAKHSLESNEAGIKYLIMGSFASAFLLMGIAFVFGASGTTDLRRIAADLTYIASNYRLYLYSGAALVLIGFAFKVAAVPFHTWVPDVYQGAPTPITAFFSVGPKAAGFAALLRIFSYGFENIAELSTIFWMLAVLTMTAGNILALRQNDIKRMLAYSSIAHAGYILVALAVGGREALSAAVFYLIAYGFFNLGAFAIITQLETRAGSKLDFSELAGLSKTHPYLSTFLAVFMFALAGFPPTIGFFGKFYLFSAAIESGFIWLTVIGVLNSFISVYYYFRVIKVSFLDRFEGVYAPVSYTPAIIAVLVITVAGTIALGIFPGHLLEFTRSAIFSYL